MPPASALKRKLFHQIAGIRGERWIAAAPVAPERAMP
jgi:hypothetical protein